MKLLSAITNRRSVRKFQTKPVSEEAINALSTAFEAAPCGMNQTDVMQGVIITNVLLRREVEKATKNACYSAPLLFLLTTKQKSPFGERDASVAAENIMVQAADLGLGSVYVMGGAMALNKHPELLKKLGVAKGYQVTVIVPVGQPAGKPADEDRRNRYHLIRK